MLIINSKKFYFLNGWYSYSFESVRKMIKHFIFESLQRGQTKKIAQVSDRVSTCDHQIVCISLPLKVCEIVLCKL